MKRHEALIPLSHDHQHALAQALRLRRAADLAPVGRRAAAEAFLEFADERLAPHFAQEERVLTDAVHAVDALAPERDRLRREHADLVARFARLRDAAHHAAGIDAELLRSTGQAVTDHVRYEERELFELLQRTFGQELPGVVGSTGG